VDTWNMTTEADWMLTASPEQVRPHVLGVAIRTSRGVTVYLQPDPIRALHPELPE
jgi:hypothetical protein